MATPTSSMTAFAEQAWRGVPGFHTRAVLVHQLFRKVIALSPTAWAQFTSGRVFNLVTSDVETLQMLSQNIMNLISSPLRIVVAMWLLYLQLGVASLVALASLILMMPIQVAHGWKHAHACCVT